MSAALGRLALVVAVLTLSADSELRAGSVTVIGNYPQANDGTLSSVTSLDGNYAKAVGFAMGAQAYALDSVTLRLAEQSGSNSTLLVELFGGTSSNPAGPALGVFNTPTIPALAGNVTFTPTAPLLLEANTNYWLEVSGQSDTLNGIVWYASTTGVTPTGVATSLGAPLTSQLGTAGSLVSSRVLNTFQVTGTPAASLAESVPEPPGLIHGGLSVIAGLLLACWRLRRRGTGSVRRSAA